MKTLDLIKPFFAHILLISVIGCAPRVHNLSQYDSLGSGTKESLSKALVSLQLENGAMDLIQQEAISGSMEIMVTTLESSLERELTRSEYSGLEKVTERAIERVFSEDDWERVLIPIFADLFTTSELRSFVNFYSSPEGKKLLRHQASIQTRSMEAGKRLGEEKVHLFQKVYMEEFWEEFPSENNFKRTTY